MNSVLKKTVIGIVTGMVAVATLSISCFALIENQHWYTLNQKNTNGSSVYLNAKKKEYTQVAVNSSDKSSVTVSLWKDEFWGFDDLCPENQTLEYGSNRRAWWFGKAAGNYFLYAESTADNIALSGYLRNYE